MSANTDLPIDVGFLLPAFEPSITIPLTAAKALDVWMRQAIVTADPGTFCLLAASILHDAVAKAEDRS